MTSNKRIILILWILFVTLISVQGQAERKYIRQGNSNFSAGKYPESEISYRKAIDKNKMSQDAQFNLGDALYKEKKYDEAGKTFQENTGATLEKKKKANSYYNLGNSLLNSNKLEESLEAYKNSLRIDPGNNEAKYNLAYVQDLIRRKEEQQKQDQNQNQKDNKKDQNKDQNKDKNKDQKRDQDKNQNKENKDQNRNQEKQQQQQNQQGISKEDAQRLLDALANDEKKVQEKVKKDKAAKERVRTLINW